MDAEREDHYNKNLLECRQGLFPVAQGAVNQIKILG